jgi:hypothetical protein
MVAILKIKMDALPSPKSSNIIKNACNGFLAMRAMTARAPRPTDTGTSKLIFGNMLIAYWNLRIGKTRYRVVYNSL